MTAKRKIFKCKVCGFHYEDEKISLDCEGYCKEHGVCSIEITKHSIERQRQQKQK